VATVATRELEVAIRRQAGVPVLELIGDIDAGADGALQDAWAEASGGVSEMVLDFTRTNYINSTGIALIVQLLANARARGITLTARGLTAHYREIFEITRLSDFMRITDD
jgi:anti-anti-sigma factor